MVTRKDQDAAGDTRYVMMRAEDRSLWARSAFLLEKYKVLVWIIGILLIAIGFQFKTPSMIVDDLQGQITANKHTEDSVLAPRVNNLDSKIDVLLRLRCIDKNLTEEQRALVGLNCAGIYKGGQ